MVISLGYSPSRDGEKWCVKNADGYLEPVYTSVDSRVDPVSNAAESKISYPPPVITKLDPASLAATRILLGSKPAPRDGSWAISRREDKSSKSQKIYAAGTQRAVNRAVALIEANPSVSLKQVLHRLTKDRKKLANNKEYAKAVEDEVRAIGRNVKNCHVAQIADFQYLETRAKMVGVPRVGEHCSFVCDSNLFDPKLEYKIVDNYEMGQSFKVQIKGTAGAEEILLNQVNIPFDLLQDSEGNYKLAFYGESIDMNRFSFMVFPASVENGAIRVEGEAREHAICFPPLRPKMSSPKAIIAMKRQSELPSGMKKVNVDKCLRLSEDSFPFINRGKFGSFTDISSPENREKILDHLDDLFSQAIASDEPGEVLELVKEIKWWMLEGYLWNLGNAAIADNLAKTIFTIKGIDFGYWKTGPYFDTYLSRVSLETAKETYESLYA